MELKTAHITARREIVLHCLFIFLISLACYFLQQPVTLNNGEGWDGVWYAKMARDFRAGNPPEVMAPFVYRVALPFITSILPIPSINKSFLLVNYVACVLSYFLFIAWIRFFIRSPYVRIVLGLLFILPFHSNIRLSFYNPVDVDQWQTVFLLLGLIMISRNNTRSPFWLAIFSSIVFCGTLVRETGILLAISYLFLSHPLRWAANEERPLQVRMPQITAFIPLAASLLAIALSHYIVVSQPSFFGETALAWLYKKSLVDYAHAWFIAFGFIPLLFCFFPNTLFRHIKEHPEHVVLVVVISLLGYIGGSATYRILFWANPLILLWAGIVLEQMPRTKIMPWMLLILGILQCVSQRIFWFLPDYPHDATGNVVMFLTPFAFDVNFTDIIGMGSVHYRLIGFAQYGVAYIFLYMLFRSSLSHRRALPQEKRT